MFGGNREEESLTGNEGTEKVKTCFDPELRLRGLESYTTIFCACIHFIHNSIFNLFLIDPSTETVFLYVISTTTTNMPFIGLTLYKRNADRFI